MILIFGQKYFVFINNTGRLSGKLFTKERGVFGF
jgi:hypothetical protein